MVQNSYTVRHDSASAAAALLGLVSGEYRCKKWNVTVTKPTLQPSRQLGDVCGNIVDVIFREVDTGNVCIRFRCPVMNAGYAG